MFVISGFIWAGTDEPPGDTVRAVALHWAVCCLTLRLSLTRLLVFLQCVACLRLTVNVLKLTKWGVVLMSFHLLFIPSPWGFVTLIATLLSACFDYIIATFLALFITLHFWNLMYIQKSISINVQNNLLPKHIFLLASVIFPALHYCVQ